MGVSHITNRPYFYNYSQHSVIDVLHYETLFTLEQRRHGAVIFHTLVCLYCFVALAILCEHYFCASLEKLCKRLRIPTDVAGATFMAAGSSMPTLFIAIASVFMGEGDIGLGTIIGSTMFNILFITAICGLCSGIIITLHTWPLIRDSFVYIVHLTALLVVIQDNIIHFYEALVFPVLYSCYILIMVCNRRLEETFEAVCGKYFNIHKGMEMIEMEDPLEIISGGTDKGDIEAKSGGRQVERVISNSRNETTTETGGETEKQESFSQSEFTNQNDMSMETTEISAVNVGNESTKNDSRKRSGDSEGSKEPSPIHGFEPTPPLQMPEPLLKRALWFIMLPVHCAFYITIPDCRVQKWEAWYPLTFVLSIVWMAALSYILVWTVSIIGETFSIPECIMGLTLLAAGSSVPDVMSSLIVAKHGMGDMALANCVGSNIFDVLCLGLPWLLATTAVHPNSVVVIHNDRIVYVSLCLFGTVFTILAAIHLNGWKLDKRLGVILMFVYAVFLTAAVVLEALPGGQGKEAP